MAETLRASPFGQTAITYGSYSFLVPGLASGTGPVRLFVNETDTSPDARVLGLPRDLNGDGLVATTNVSSSYYLLPIKIEISWSGHGGPETEALYMMLAQESS
jgi:hypothetical protein